VNNGIFTAASGHDVPQFVSRASVNGLRISSPAGIDLACLVVIITTVNSKQIIKQLEAEGWFLARVKGSHHQFKHLSKPGLVTVKHPDSDIPAGTLHSIRKQAGWK
jgi:predicted RNA binding protein YcfA (HicA-like mRNA interferase family)